MRAIVVNAPIQSVRRKLITARFLSLELGGTSGAPLRGQRGYSDQGSPVDGEQPRRVPEAVQLGLGALGIGRCRTVDPAGGLDRFLFLLGGSDGEHLFGPAG
jgi:hypothetical protein